MYNFEQAIEGLAHGIPVRRLSWNPVYLSAVMLDTCGDFMWIDGIDYIVDLDDFYATDWVDAS